MNSRELIVHLPRSPVGACIQAMLGIASKLAPTQACGQAKFGLVAAKLAPTSGALRLGESLLRSFS